MAATIIALTVSTLYILLTTWLAFWLRRYVTYFIEQPLVRALFLEAIATAELCGACFELIIILAVNIETQPKYTPMHNVAANACLLMHATIVFGCICREIIVTTRQKKSIGHYDMLADNWGVSMYAIYLFVLTIYWSIHWGDASACPYTHLEDVFLGNKSLRIALLLIWAELIGGLAIFRYIQVLWSLEIVSTHKNRAFEECTTDLQVPVIIGVFVEGVATCICRVISRMLGDLNPRLSTAIDAFVGTSLVVAAFNYSGGYFNPALATSLKYGCLGTSFIEHVIVYWIGTCIGSIASLSVYKMPFIQDFIQQQKEKVS